jgi:hypothetical protein
MDQRYFKKNGFIVKLTRDQGEPDEHFVERGEFVVSQKPGRSDEYQNAVRLSRIYRNNKHDKAVYSPNIMGQLEMMSTKMFEE